MAKEYTYKRIREIRKKLRDELSREIPIFTPAHLMLIESRLQTVIMADLIDTDLEAEEIIWTKDKIKHG